MQTLDVCKHSFQGQSGNRKLMGFIIRTIAVAGIKIFPIENNKLEKVLVLETSKKLANETSKQTVLVLAIFLKYKRQNDKEYIILTPSCRACSSLEKSCSAVIFSSSRNPADV